MVRQRWIRRLGVMAIVGSLLTAACTGSDEPDDGANGESSQSAPETTIEPADEPEGRYVASITYTEHGVPHIVADDVPSVLYGQGWAMAADHACTILDQVVKLRGMRARYHGEGPDGDYLNSDIVYRSLNLIGVAGDALESFPADQRAAVDGFTAGVNRWLIDEAPGGLAGWCSDSDWVADVLAGGDDSSIETSPLTPPEMYALIRDFALVGSTRNLIDYMVDAAPPASEATIEGAAHFAAGPPNEEVVVSAGTAVEVEPLVGVGSNAWGIGSDLTDGPSSILMANPHYPWEGELRFWESHLKVPGTIDVYGASPIGLPGVVIGFNEDIAWTRTVSAGRRFTGYQLELDPANPTRYRFGDTYEDMVPISVSVEVLDEDGSIRTVDHTLWTTRHGYVVSLPGASWTAERAYAVRDANLDNDVLVEMVLGEIAASSLEEFREVQCRAGGNPFANTVVAAKDGRVLYMDTAVTPYLSDETIERWQQRLIDDSLADFLNTQRLTLLDGSNPDDEWITDGDGAVPGTVPCDLLPSLERTDFVQNANNSFWLANPDEPLIGYSPLHGPIDVAQSARTRRNLYTLMLEGESARYGAPEGWTAESVWSAVLSNEGLAARELQGPIVERCRELGDDALQPACEVLAQWDGRADLDSPGAVLWREFISQFPWSQQIDAGPLWAEPFDANDPVFTPRGFAPVPQTGDDPITAAIAKAVDLMAAAGLELDSSLREVQYYPVGVDRTIFIPVHGAGPLEGVENLIGFSPGGTSTEGRILKGDVLEGSFELSADGYPINYGTSYLLVVAFEQDGPRGIALMTYGQSGDLQSELSRDQAVLFSEKRWRPTRFRESDIAAHAQGETIRLVEP